MSSRWLLGLCGVLALGGEVAANGRPPGTSTINFRQGLDSHVAAGMTFGLVISRDGGATWAWVCEDAIGYGGMYDPDYVFTQSGALFATTFDGLQVVRDGCTFTKPLDAKFVSTIAQGPDGALYYGAADGPTPLNPGDSNLYRSDDDGRTWPVSAMPGVLNDWWQSLEVAPSDPDRLYLTGFRFVPNPNGGGNVKRHLLFRSSDGAVSWQPLPVTAFATMPNSTIEIVGISNQDPDRVYARVSLEDNNLSDAIYRSDDAGETWKRVLGKAHRISFVVRRATGELIAATQVLGAVRSTDHGETWTALVDPPHINCLAENTAGEVWACTQNYGGMQAPSDGHGIMKSTDLATWTPVLRYQDIKEPVACADGTVQRDRCDVEQWCGLCQQLGCDPARACSDDPGPDGGPGPLEPGCCKNSAAPAPGALVLVPGVGLLLLLVLRPRRR